MRIGRRAVLTREGWRFKASTTVKMHCEYRQAAASDVDDGDECSEIKLGGKKSLALGTACFFSHRPNTLFGAFSG
jgi:hypothetical protein